MFVPCNPQIYLMCAERNDLQQTMAKQGIIVSRINKLMVLVFSWDLLTIRKYLLWPGCRCLTCIRPTCNFDQPQTAGFYQHQQSDEENVDFCSCSFVAWEQYRNCSHTSQLINTSCLFAILPVMLTAEQWGLCVLNNCARDTYLIVILCLSFQRWTV